MRRPCSRGAFQISLAARSNCTADKGRGIDESFGPGAIEANCCLDQIGSKMISVDKRKSEEYDPWYVKVAFSVLLCA